MSEWHKNYIKLASDGKLDELKNFEKQFPEYYLYECLIEDHIIPNEIISIFGYRGISYTVANIAFFAAAINDHLNICKHLYGIRCQDSHTNLYEFMSGQFGLTCAILFIAGIKEQMGKLDVSNQLLSLCNTKKDRFIHFLLGKLYAGYDPLENEDDILLLKGGYYDQDGGGDFYEHLLPAARGGNINALKHLIKLIPQNEFYNAFCLNIVKEALDYKQYDCAEYILQNVKINREISSPFPYESDKMAKEIWLKYFPTCDLK